ncbi:MAG TPA: alcohol dehydrogenase catalytic domain-containing protein [Mycobacterium sp.]|uniref:Alcohol dehydrogenase catalytic domain-containing protein n=1 Tax=Microbacterium rhizomatis TaxID=1631477 RepID=A0A5J5J027_9MICO|nr:alcohol dehydrogenase catalytic domain-containing protein [Microbacterium rhizomatis]KAA9104523.1 alcohol dehydrogenase catalytic domain-containing protein [Microbacterium rhizomatis]
MKAVVIEEFGHAKLTDIERPVLHRPTDVIVQVAAAGICQTDIETIEGGLVAAYGVPQFPYVPGHETTGWVRETGEAVTAVAVGDPVVLHPVSTCGVCSACRRGADMYCPSRTFPGVDGSTPGGWAEFIRVDERALVRVGADTDLLALCPLTDAGLTAYHAVERALRTLPSSTDAAVIGLGGVGLFGLQLLRAAIPGKIVVLEPNLAKTDLAYELGADEVVTAVGSQAQTQARAIAPEGFSLVFDFVGAPESADTAVSLAARGGVVSIVGAGGTLTIDTLSAVVAELTILFNLVGTHTELETLVRHRAPAIRSPYTTYPLADFERAIEDMRAGRVVGRPVLLP